MTFQAPPTLLQLGVQSLVRNEALTISTLQDLPMVLFPPLFKESDTQRRKKIIKALVTDWPYPCLPAGLLMNNPNLEIYQAMLDGVDTWLRRRFRPRGQKLQVVDLRNVCHDFWEVWTGRMRGEPSAETLPERPGGKGLSRPTLRRHLKIVAELQLPQDEQQAQLLQWAERRKASLQLCCVKLKIGTLPFYRVRDVLKILKPEFIKELELNTVCNLSTLVHLVPYISKMSHLQKVMVIRIFRGRATADTEDKRVTKIVSVFSKLSCLQHLSLDDVYFVNDHMKLLLRCLKTPLESLSISLCKFSQSDLDSFAQWTHCQLKHLYLKGVILSDLNFLPLKFFLESVACTLKTLKLKDCRMKDPDLRVLLPALSQCCQLTSINFYDNDFSSDILKELLHHTANLSQLTKELYPAPKEVYNHLGYINVEEFSQRCAELKNTVVTERQFRSLRFGSNACYDCGKRCTYELETTLCDC
ncbi:preferentially expressed antigen in melanoma-like protein 7 [Arvicola amphibius]|uniref:preferentially expressed antigen in melanoma-like protein 7 n=1 Tax=Arvicola amphibius TaxID=1047088 RepID=UPI0018E3B3EF|nr:preferentially expressed antigen in melanoma-like protein 7 [Arvicola amphibius]